MHAWVSAVADPVISPRFLESSRRSRGMAPWRLLRAHTCTSTITCPATMRSAGPRNDIGRSQDATTRLPSRSGVPRSWARRRSVDSANCCQSACSQQAALHAPSRAGPMPSGTAGSAESTAPRCGKAMPLNGKARAAANTRAGIPLGCDPAKPRPWWRGPTSPDHEQHRPSRPARR